jgi:hypothetical protein
LGIDDLVLSCATTVAAWTQNEGMDAGPSPGMMWKCGCDLGMLV